MTDYSVADAKNNLPKLIDRALAGEEVRITRRGEVVVRLTREKPIGAPVDVTWLDKHRFTPAPEDRLNSDELFRMMREEEDQRF